MITFDSKAYVAEKAHLDVNIRTHGGGGTQILFGFKKFIDQLKQNVYKHKNIALIFLSDGDDSYFKQYFG